MQFMYPSLLWALGLMVIPVIVHLFNFRKPKHIIFPSIRFLQSVQKKNAANRRLKHLLIMACRMLAIALLVLAFAQPFIPSHEEGLQGKYVDIYLDNSPSMSNLTGDKNGITQGVLLMGEILTYYPQETKYKLITNDFAPSSNQYKSKEQIEELIYQIQETSLDRSMEEVVQKVQKDETPNRDVFIISDFQRSTKPSLAIKDTTSKYYWLPIAFDENENISIDSVYLASPFVIAGQRNQLVTTVSNRSDEEAFDLNIKLFVNDHLSSSASIDIAPQSKGEITFELEDNLDQHNVCKILIEDFPVTFDNDYHFVINTLHNIRISEVVESDQSTRFEKVYASNELFDYKKYSMNSLNYDQIKNSDVVILNEIENFDSGLANILASIQEKGKSIVFVPSQVADGLSYLTNLGIGYSQKASQEENELNIPDLNHPFFYNMFEKMDKRTKMPKVSVNWSYLNSSVLLQTKLGTPYLSMIKSTGKTYLFSGAITSETSSLADHALFVPLAQRIAENSSHANEQLAYTTDQKLIQLALDSIQKQKLYKLSADNNDIIPEQRSLGNQLILSIPQELISPNVYQLTQEQAPIRPIAFNYPSSESELEPYSFEELESAVSNTSNATLFQPQEADQFRDSIKEKYVQQDLWKYALILCLIFLIAETLLIRFL